MYYEIIIIILIFFVFIGQLNHRFKYCQIKVKSNVDVCSISDSTHLQFRKCTKCYAYENKWLLQ